MLEMAQGINYCEHLPLSGMVVGLNGAKLSNVIRYMLKDTTVGLFISKLLAICWGMLFKVFRLGYLCLGWIC